MTSEIEKAIANGLSGEDRKGAMFGLGSTYRCLAEHQNSMKVFDQPVKGFAEDRSLKVFRTLTLYNLGKSEESVGELLVQLLDTTNGPVRVINDLARHRTKSNLTFDF